METKIDITIKKNEDGIDIVEARELWTALNSKEKFTDWVVRQLLDWGFVEDKDYYIIIEEMMTGRLLHKNMKSDNQQVTKGPVKKHFYLTIDCCKEIAMVQRSIEGHQVRQWFIEKEKELRAVKEKMLPQTYIEALKALVASEEEKEKQRLLLEAQAPTVAYANEVLSSDSCFTSTDIAKGLGMRSAKELHIALEKENIIYHIGGAAQGRWVLYSQYSTCGYAKDATLSIKGMSGTVHTKHYLKWTEKGRKFIHEVLNK